MFPVPPTCEYDPPTEDPPGIPAVAPGVPPYPPPVDVMLEKIEALPALGAAP